MTQSAKAPRSVFLALNETRKTLLASRIEVLQGALGEAPALLRPGDGLWVARPLRREEARRLSGSLELLFLDANHRVVLTSADARSATTLPDVVGAAGVLAVARGTVVSSHTRPGDRILLEEIVVPSR